jgi:hypothetical protein
VRLRRSTPSLESAAGEKVLAWAAAPSSGSSSTSGVVAGTLEALYLPGPPERRVPWEQVEAADWDVESETLTITEVGSWGEARPVHTLTLTEPARLLQLVRERVTATVVLQRHVAIRDKRGVRVIARRAPSGRRELSWLFEYDEGIDPADPFVDQAAREALSAAREEVGDS